MTGVLSPAAMLAIGSATVAAFVAATLGALVAAPGWRDARWVPLVAGTASAFAAFSAIPVVATSPRLVVAATGWRWAMAGAHVVAWLLHCGDRLALRPATVRIATAGVLALAIAMAVPGAAFSEPVQVRTVAWLASTFRHPAPGPLSHLSFAVLASLFTAMGILQLRAGRRGAPGARATGLAMLLLSAAGLHEELVALGLAADADVLVAGAVVPAVVVARLTGARFVAEARELAALRDRLEHRIRGRSRVLALSRAALHRTEALASLGRVARRAAHEVNNPAASVIANLGWAREQLAAGGPIGDVAAALDDALESARRVRALGARLAELGAEPPDRRAPVPLAPLVAHALALARTRVPGGDAVPVDVDVAHAALADPPVLARALETLLENALHAAAARPPGHVAVRAEHAGGRVTLRIDDAGPGMDPEVLDRIGEPFFTTRPFESHGLGVATARVLATALDGELRFESTPGEGTRAILELPSASAAPRASPAVGGDA